MAMLAFIIFAALSPAASFDLKDIIMKPDPELYQRWKGTCAGYMCPPSLKRKPESNTIPANNKTSVKKCCQWSKKVVATKFEHWKNFTTLQDVRLQWFQDYAGDDNGKLMMVAHLQCSTCKFIVNRWVAEVTDIAAANLQGKDEIREAIFNAVKEVVNIPIVNVLRDGPLVKVRGIPQIFPVDKIPVIEKDEQRHQIESMINPTQREIDTVPAMMEDKICTASVRWFTRIFMHELAGRMVTELFPEDGKRPRDKWITWVCANQTDLCTKTMTRDQDDDDYYDLKHEEELKAQEEERLKELEKSKKKPKKEVKPKKRVTKAFLRELSELTGSFMNMTRDDFITGMIETKMDKETGKFTERMVGEETTKEAKEEADEIGLGDEL